ncbi:hypothetical protein NMY22_g10044 [Coprinellus aureogranulatus]|nr:hypothetical protein NMY22_g10044 [Coprinellus aureogranulatus]
MANDQKAKASRQEWEMNNHQRGLVDDIIEEGHYEAGIEILLQLRSPQHKPSASHIRQLMFLALHPVHRPSLSPHPRTVTETPRKSRIAPTSSQIQPKAAIASLDLLHSLIATNSPGSLGRALPSYTLSESAPEELTDSLLAKQATCIKGAKHCWELLEEGFAFRNEVFFSPKGKSKLRRDHSIGQALFLDSQTGTAGIVSDEAWPFLNWLVCLFEKDEDVTAKRDNVRYSPLFLEQLPPPRGTSTARWDFSLVTKIILYCLEQNDSQRHRLGLRLLYLLCNLTSTVHVEQPTLVNSVFRDIMASWNDPKRIQDFLSSLDPSPNVERFKISFCQKLLSDVAAPSTSLQPGITSDAPPEKAFKNTHPPAPSLPSSSSIMASDKKINVLMCGTGEYTTGWTGSGASQLVLSLSPYLTCGGWARLGGEVQCVPQLIDAIEQVDWLGMVGVNGGKFPAIRQHLDKNIGGVYKDMDLTWVPSRFGLVAETEAESSFEEYPKEGKVDPEAYKAAIDDLKPGDAVIIFTPDSTHFPIALYAIERGLHVLVTKPAVQKLEHHNTLIEAAKKKGVVCWVEHHKRYDPTYSDAKARVATLGEFNFFNAWMAQPKSQLETFKAWAGKDSDIRQAGPFAVNPQNKCTDDSLGSYYLSSHHVDICCWILQDIAVPTRVVASSAAGIATSEPYKCVPNTEDTITLMIDFQSLKSPNHRGTAISTASWTAPLKSGVHTSQHWYYMGEKGDLAIDQAHRGYEVTNDDTGKAWVNPFYMKYSPSNTGHFDGQRGYGYISIEKFIDASKSVNEGKSKPEEFDGHGFPTILNTVLTTAILHAGRISLDEKRPVNIKRDGDKWILE